MSFYNDLSIGLLQNALTAEEESRANGTGAVAVTEKYLHDSNSDYKLAVGNSQRDCVSSYAKGENSDTDETQRNDGALVNKKKCKLITPATPMPAPPLLLNSAPKPSPENTDPSKIGDSSLTSSSKEGLVHLEVLCKINREQISMQQLSESAEPKLNLFEPSDPQLNFVENHSMHPSKLSSNDYSEPEDMPSMEPTIVVSPLSDSPENIRWMYKYENDKLWTPFYGFDSLHLEQRYQEVKSELKFPLGIRNTVAVDINNGPNITGVAASAFTNATAMGSSVSTQGSVTTTTVAGGTTETAATSSYGSTIVAEFLTNSERRFSLVNKTIFAYSETNKHKKGSASGTDNSSSKKWFSTWSASAAGASEPTLGNDQTDDLEQGNQESGSSTPQYLVTVRSGLYEADLDTWKCRSTFWPGDVCDIDRGTWFHEGTWEPIAMDHAEQLEQEHLEKFAETPLTSSVFPLFHSLPESPTRRVKTVAHRLTFPEYHVDWTSPTDIHLYRKKSSSIFMKSVSQKLGFEWGERITRGYYKQALISDKPPDIGHVVFVVHGIGQKMDAGRIVRNCAAFRENVNGIQKKYFNDDASTNDKIASFFPIEWRSSLKLDGDVVESITPNKILGLRQLLNTTAMDIMYYTSPLYRKEIQTALRNELNRTYRNFMSRNPFFVRKGGKFSILAHSLGAVITYDIITSPFLDEIDDWAEGRIEGRAGSKVRADQINGECVQVADEMAYSSRLDFQLEHFFCLGSPLSVFLALRWREPHNPILRPYILPGRLCKRMYNIFNMNDPVAYRLEPLLNKSYIHIPPVAIVSHNTSSHTKYEEMVREILDKQLVPPEFREDYDSYTARIQATNVKDPISISAISVVSASDSVSDYSLVNSSPPAVDSLSSIGTVSDSSYSISSDFPSLRSPPPSSLPSAIADSFFSAIYNYWNNKQPASSYLPDEPNEMEVAAAKLDSMNFQMSSLDEMDSTSSRRGSLSMNVGSSSLQQCFSSTASDCTFSSSDESSSVPRSNSNANSFNVQPGSCDNDSRPQQPVLHDFDYRLDYVQRESNLPIPTGYLAALTSHTSYWSSPDIGFFVLSHLYNRIPCDAPKEACSTVATVGATNNNVIASMSPQ